MPVLSVGNLHLGGSGKTPMVAAIATHLREAGERPAVLSRGYGRRTSGFRIASVGEGPSGDPRDIGDEPAMLAELVPGVPVVVGEDRFLAGLEALQQLSPTPGVFVLDDGFSHLRLARDVDLLVFPATRPWGTGRLLPFGDLREPLEAVAHADVAVLTGANPVTESDREDFSNHLRPLGFRGAAFAAGLAAELEPALSAGTRVVLATGVARPERVAETVQSLGVDVVKHLCFGDHHSFPQSSLAKVERALRRAHTEILVVTSKDLPKLKDRLKKLPVEVRVRATPQESFWKWLDQSSLISKRGSPPSTD